VHISNAIVEDVAVGNGRILCGGPPRHGKTELDVDFTSVWFLNLWPTKTILYATYSEDFAQSRARLIRNIILENQKLLRIRLAEDSRGVGRFHTVQGGGFISLGIGSGLSGLPADLLLLDDLHPSWEKSQNKKEQEKLKSWFQDAYQRLNPGASIIVIGARWSVNDLQQWLIDSHSDQWRALIFPAISKGKNVDLLNRPKGSALCPDLYDVDRLKKIKMAVGEKKWAAQYQQSPLRDEMVDNEEIVFSEDIISKIKNSHLPAFEDMPLPYAPPAINYLAVDFGKKSSHTAVTLCQVVDSEDKDPDNSELHITFLKQYPLKTLLRSIVKDLDKFSLNTIFGGLCPVILVDASGSGAEYALEEMHQIGMKPIIPLVILSTGKSKSRLRVPKEQLTRNLVDFISYSRLKISPNLRDSGLLFSELRGYRARVSPRGRTITYKPYSQATDDLIDSLGMCAWAAVKRWQPMWAQRAEGLYDFSSVTRRPLSKNRSGSLSNLSKSLYALNNPHYSELRGWRGH
jgi:hypothetical protein